MRNKRLLFCLAFALGGMTVPANAQMITNSPNLPPPNGTYISPALAHQLYDLGFMTLEVFNINHFGFSLSDPPPPDLGQVRLHDFNSTLTGQMRINGGAPSPFFGNAQVSVAVQKVAGPIGPTGLFQTEMLQLNLVGLPGGVMIRESPTLSSAGGTQIQDVGGGLFQIDSFFDIFTEISIDGGQNWFPSTGSGRVNLHELAAPEPSSVALIALGLLGTCGFVARRRK